VKPEDDEIMKEQKPAKIILEDDTGLTGMSIGSGQNVSGEVVFNTGMVGYPEALTDPSYHGQILVLTYPLIGNYGIPDTERENGLLKNFESEKIQVAGLVVCEYSDEVYHWSAVKTLSAWFKEQGKPAITGVDTRLLTKKLRNQGTMLGKLVFDSAENVPLEDPNKRNLVAEVSITDPVEYSKGKQKIILVDCGVKNNIIQSFLRRNITIIRVPWNYDFSTLKADGLVMSNGPGDPQMCRETIEHLKQTMSRNRPILGICLGSQILGLASGARTYKLKYGHRSHNQPCNEMGTKRCFITTQNHGFAIDSKSLSQDWREWFYNDNDGTNEGLLHISKPFFGAQFHPEASPGPDDTEFVFDMFIRAIS
jgi:carbamoyl-phosphate synthase small subunit